MVNLFALAVSNSTSIEHRFDTIGRSLTTAEADTLERFVNWVVTEGHIAINMRQTTLLVFITTDTYQNIYEWANSQSIISRRPIEDILRQRLGVFYERRLTFEGFFEHGSEFRYGALITDGIGAAHYGNYCTIFREDVVLALELAYLKSDSLNSYMIDDTTVDRALIEQDAAPHNYRHLLAGIKHYNLLNTAPESSWASMLCSGNDYIEAIFRGNLLSNNIKEVRMLKSDYDTFFHQAFEDFRGKLDEAERAYVDGFAAIIKLLDQHGISLKVI